MDIIDWLRAHLGGSAGGKDAPAAEALERIVQLANPRLAFAHRYKSRLTPAVRNAMDYAVELVARVAPAREASAAAWQSDRCIRAMFATAQDVTRVFSRSPEVQSWFAANPQAREIFAVLSMQLVERRVLGTALENGALQRDVSQTTVSFTDHRARIHSGTESDLREDLQRRVVDQLALAAIALASESGVRRTMLEQERALLRARLRLLGAKGAGVSGLGMRVSPELGEIARIQLELSVNEQSLTALAAGSQDLEHQVDCLRAVFMGPSEHFSVSARRIHLDSMNVMLPDDSSTQGATLDLQIALVPIPDSAPEYRTFVFARFPRAELMPRGELLREAEGLLH